MADTLSIVASVVTLIQVSVQVTVLIREFRNEVSGVDATLIGLLSDVDGFQRVLESLKETIENSDINPDPLATGHVGSHWRNLARSLNDGAEALQKLHLLLDNVNKKTSVLDAPRKQLRLKSATGQISRYREQIQSSHTALQLSLSTIILWNQATFQKSTEKIPGKIVPTLDKLYDEFRTFGALLNERIEKLQKTAVKEPNQESYDLKYMSNLRECVRSAADVVSTASTTLVADTNKRMSIKYGSDFGDIFLKDSSEPMLRWIRSHSVYEYEDADAPLPAPSEAEHELDQTEYQSDSDSDSDIEFDMIRSLFREGKNFKEHGDLKSAVRYFRNCLKLLSTHDSLSPQQLALFCDVTKVELLELLADSYCLLGSWDDAKSIMMEKLAITKRHVGQKNELYLRDTLKLAEIMMNGGEYAEAHLHARKTLKGFKKLGEPGIEGYAECLQLLILLCQFDNKADEEEGYSALLSDHKRKNQRPVLSEQTTSTPPSRSSFPPDCQSSPTLTGGDEYPPEEDAIAQKKRNLVLQSGIDRSSLPSLEERGVFEIQNTLGDMGQVIPSNKTTRFSQELVGFSQNKFSYESSSPEPPLDTCFSRRESSQSVQEDRIPSEDQVRISEPQNDLQQSRTSADVTIPNVRISTMDGESTIIGTDHEESTATIGEMQADFPPIRRSVSDSHIPKTQVSDQDFAKGWLDKSYAALEYGEALQQSTDTLESEPIAPPHPILSPIFVGLSKIAASIHVVRGKDARSLSCPDSPKVEETVTHSETSDEPILGVWACIKCRSETLQYSSEPVCRSCRKKRSDICPSSFNGFSRDPRDCYQTLLPFWTPADMPEDMIIRLKVLLIGDTLCGKTYLASLWSQNKVPEGDTSETRTFVKSMTTVEGRVVELALYDSTGVHDHERTRRQSYDGSDIVLICFDITNPVSLETVTYLWNDEADTYLGGVPKVLVGCKKDLRNNRATLESLRRQNLRPISPYAADALAVRIKALAYFETSAVMGQGLFQLFDYVGHAAMKVEPPQPKARAAGIRRALSRRDVRWMSWSSSTKSEL